MEEASVSNIDRKRTRLKSSHVAISYAVFYSVRFCYIVWLHDDLPILVFILLNAMPVAANSTMLAVQFNVKPNVVSFSSLITTLISIITIPICLYLIGV